MRTKSLWRRQLRFARYPGWLALCVLPALMGCDDDESGSLPGEIGNNHFFYVCSTIDDAHCRDGLTGFPEKIAVGGSFELPARDDDGDTLTVRSASPVMVTPLDQEFRFRRAGFNAFLAFDFGEFVDFAHVEAVPVDDILVVDSFGRSESTLTLVGGERTTMTAVPIDAVGDTLAGSLVYRWASDDDSVVDVESVGTSVQLTAIGNGTAQVRVSHGDDVFRVLHVVVQDDVSFPTDAGNDTDAGSPDAAVPDAGPLDADVPDADVTADGGSDGLDGGETSAPADGGDDLETATSIDTNTFGADAAIDGGL
jgi:hypothetical protein